MELIERTAWSGGEVGEVRAYESAYGSSLRSANTAILRMSPSNSSSFMFACGAYRDD